MGTAMGRLWYLLVLLVLYVSCLYVSKAQEMDCIREDCFCSRRLRLENSSGVIVDHFNGGKYKSQTRCLFYIETDRPMSSLWLRFNRFDLECLWDYLYVFSGDSVHSNKIAAFTGDLLLPEPESGNEPGDLTPIPTQVWNETNSTITSGSGMESGSGSDVPIPFREPHDITLESPGSSLLLYFFTDLAQEGTGFNLSYWANYTCPKDCLGRGNCSEEGECECGEGWSGEWCQVPVCPNDCFGNGECSGGICLCNNHYTGVDCSIPVSSPHWEALDFTTAGQLTGDLLARAGHSSVVWGTDDVIIFGGYRFPGWVGETGDGGSGGSGEEGSTEKEEGEVVTGPQLLRYQISSRKWEELEVNLSAPYPSPRYGHSAVIYNDTMHIYGGVLIPEEIITNEHWALHLPTLTWSPLTLHTDDDVIDNSTLYNSTTININADVTMAITNQNRPSVPLRIRSHTAHVVAAVMVALFGMTDSQDSLLYYVQEYNFISGEWSVPSQNGMKPEGRMGHSSVYDEETGLVYVYGGHVRSNVSHDLLVYDPVTRYWSKRTSGPLSVYLHTSLLLWGRLMAVFGGSGGGDCFFDQLLVYNTECDEWFETDYLGLPGNARRIAHIAFIDVATDSMTVFGGFLGQPHGDMFQLLTGNCSVYASEEECTSGSTVFCGWISATNSCVALVQSSSQPPCTIDECMSLSSCDECIDGVNCTWSEADHTCRGGLSPSVNATCPTANNATDGEEEQCERFSQSCEGCWMRGCQWNATGCVAPGLNVSTVDCPASCPSLSSCSECSSSDHCMWCSSLSQCISANSTHAYAFTYPFGQCLGYVTSVNQCPVSCDSHVTCEACHAQVECGWCRDPADTGLGTCLEGGFLSPLGSNSSDSSACPETYWSFEECPACQCNGHSACVNESVCEQCQNNTQGDNCQICADGYYGNAEGGGTCTECDCNGYDSSCDDKSGECTCYDVGVAGPHCAVCNTNSSYEGDADNICYYELSVGFVYTFSVTDPDERETFYLTVPEDDSSLKFEFDIRNNPHNQEVLVQLFLGRVSEGFWVLANLTDPIKVTGGGQFTRDLDDRSGSRNRTDPRLFSFAHPRLRSTSNFTELFNSRTEHDYTNKMWNGDVALIIHVYNLADPLSYKITLDQTNLWFLLYFFATFILCFSGLLTAFMIGWYLKKKIDRRRYMRQQYRDLRRRVARPFSRIKLIVRQRLYDGKPSVQRASYISAQTCKSGKAAVLTSFIQLPGDSASGRPAPGRTGVCLGTALVKVSKRSTKDRGGGGGGKRKEGRGGRRGRMNGGGEEMVGIQLQGRGEVNGSLRARTVT